MPPEQPNTFRGWTLSTADRSRLLPLFPPPAYPNLVSNQVTFAGPKGAAMPVIHDARVVGSADDGQGVQALVVEINGTTARPDGSTYHMTWSLAAGRRAQESNGVLRSSGWRPVNPTSIALSPAGK